MSIIKIDQLKSGLQQFQEATNQGCRMFCNACSGVACRTTPFMPLIHRRRSAVSRALHAAGQPLPNFIMSCGSTLAQYAVRAARV
jgi:hypothetical protein